MDNPIPQKKPAPQSDWHRADIVAALWKRGTSLRRLSRRKRLAPDSLKMVLQRPWPHAEKIVADFLQLPPQQIWPSRYNADGSPKRGLHSLNHATRKAV